MFIRDCFGRKNEKGRSSEILFYSFTLRGRIRQNMTGLNGMHSE